MNKQHWVIGLFLLLFLVLLVSFNATKPRIVVLHSSGKNLPWVTNMDTAMKQALSNNRTPLSVQWHYMDLENKINAEQRKVAVADAKRLISQIDPDLLIAIDDEANALVGKQYAGQLRPKVLFVSIDQKPQKYGYHQAANVSGILERLPLQAIHESLQLSRHNRPLRIAAVSMNDETGLAEMQQTIEFNWQPHTLVATLSAQHFEQWQDFVRSLANQADILLVFNSDGLKRSTSNMLPVPASEVTQWTEQNSVPLPIGVTPDFVLNGGGFMVSASADDFGKRAVSMAIEWLQQHDSAPAPAMITSQHFHIGMRAQSLQNRNITLPSIYREAARMGGNYFP